MHPLTDAALLADADAPDRPSGVLVRAGVALGIGILVLLGWSAAASAAPDARGDLPSDLGGATSGIVDPLVAGLPPVAPPTVTIPPVVPPVSVPTPPTVPPVSVPTPPSVPPVSDLVDQATAVAPSPSSPALPPIGVPGSGAPELPIDPGATPVPSIPDEGSLVPPAMPPGSTIPAVEVPGLPIASIGDEPVPPVDRPLPAASPSTSSDEVAGTSPALVDGVRASLDRLGSTEGSPSAQLAAATEPATSGGSDVPSTRPGSLPICGATGSVNHPSSSASAPATLQPGPAVSDARAQMAVQDGSLGCSSVARARPPVAPD
jgi:hypothetical protein